MKSIKYIFVALLLCICQTALAQSVIRGIIVDEQDKPLTGVNVRLMHNNHFDGGATSDVNGRFSINVHEGTYEVQISYIGYTPISREVKVGTLAVIDLGRIQLRESDETLQSVEIVGRQRRDYNSDYSYSSTKMPIRNKELAASVSTITKELIKDRQAYQIADAVRGASSVQQIGFYNHFNIRGITQTAYGQVTNGIRTNQIYFAQPLTQNVERVEVIKGPGSIALSSTDPGGTINIVTKKPLRETRREVGLSAGSYSTLRGSLDFTGAINQEKTLLYRINAGVQRAKSYRDLIENNGLLISPSISYIPNDRTAINLELIYQDNYGKLDRGQPTFGDAKTRADLLKTPISMSMGAATDYYHTTDFVATFSLSQTLAKGLKFNATYLKELWTEDMKEHRTNNRYVKDKDGKDLPNLIQLRYWERSQLWATDALNAYLSYDWAIGSIKSTTLVGYDMNELNKPKGNGYYQARGVAKNADGTTIYQKYGDKEIEKSLGGYFDLNNPTMSAYKTAGGYSLVPVAIPVQKIAMHSAYVQNLTRWNGFTVLLSLRGEYLREIQNFGQANEAKHTHKEIIPRIGVSYELTKELSAYATYLEGFQSQAQAFDAMPALSEHISEEKSMSIVPMRSNLIEAGVKGEFFRRKLKATLSVFNINRTNILMKEDDDKFSVRGADRSRGVEMELAGYLTTELQVSAAYSYIDAIIVRDTDKTLVGQRKEATPRNNASLWVKYSFAPRTALQGLTLGFGLQHSGDRLSWWARSLTLPAYTVADAVISYQPVGTNLDFSLKVNNVFNTTYWTGALNKTWTFPGAPRNFMFNTTFRF